MNFLAHALLAGDDPDLILGQLAGDFVRGRLVADEHGALHDGIRMHRALDRFTDSHPQVAQSRARLTGPSRRFAGIIIDVYYDHFLAQHWSRYCDEPLAEFTARVYRLLDARGAELPPRLQRFAPYMIERDLLGEIGSEAGLRESFERLDSRFARTTPLRGAARELLQSHDALRADFLAFFPVARDFSHAQVRARHQRVTPSS